MAEKNILDAFKEDQTAETIDTTKKLKVGIIGCGWIADAHIAEYKQMEDVEIVAGADLVPGKAEAFFKKHGVEGVRCYPDHASMLDAEELDAVSVCTYNRTHAECSIYALKKGVNVLLEKPMCVTLDEAVEICKAEKESGKVLSIGFQPRFDANMKYFCHFAFGKIVPSTQGTDVFAKDEKFVVGFHKSAPFSVFLL